MPFPRRTIAAALCALLVAVSVRDALANVAAVTVKAPAASAVPAVAFSPLTGPAGLMTGGLSAAPSLNGALPGGLPALSPLATPQAAPVSGPAAASAPRTVEIAGVRSAPLLSPAVSSPKVGAPASMAGRTASVSFSAKPGTPAGAATADRRKARARASVMTRRAAPVLESIGKDASPAQLHAASRGLLDILTGAASRRAAAAPVPTSARSFGRARGLLSRRSVSRTGVKPDMPKPPPGSVSRNTGASLWKSALGIFKGKESAAARDGKAAEGFQHKLWFKIIASLILGIGVGLLLGPDFGLVSAKAASMIVQALAFPGKLFLSVVQMVAIPLVFSSVVAGIGGSKNFQQLKNLGLKAAIYFTLTTAVAATIGISVAYLIQPGTFFAMGALPAAATTAAAAAPAGVDITFGAIMEKVLGLIPSNPLAAFVTGNMLQLVFFAILMGVALASMKARHSKPLLDLMDSTQRVSMTVVKWAMRLAPLAVFGLIAKVCAESGAAAILGMGVYVGTVLLGLLGVLGFYLLLVSLFGKKSPLAFLRSAKDPILLAFSTSSSAAAMPVSMKTAKEKLKVRPYVADVLIPIGATINMDGTALYQVVATVFLAQVFGVPLALPSLLLIVGTAVGASIGTPGTPGVGMVILSTILASVGIPLEGIALLLGVDRILDMCRSAINVSGDLTATVVLDKLLGRKKLPESAEPAE